MSRPNVCSLQVDLNRLESRTAQLGLRYLHLLGDPLRNGVKVAIACLYSPLGAAVEGQSPENVRLRVGASRGSFEVYMALASLSPDNLVEPGPSQPLDPKQNLIKTTLVENKPAGLGAKYLNCGVIEPVVGVELAILCLYGPLGIARSGGSRCEIDTAIAQSRRIFEKYMDLALQFMEDDKFVRFSSPVPKTLEESVTQVSQGLPLSVPPADLNGAKDEDDIDLDEEL